jgi:hypothetical protein
MHKFEILIPEIKSTKIQELLKYNPLIGSLPPTEQKLLVVMAIKKLNAYYNYNVINMDDIDAKEAKMPVWLGGLAGISVRSLFAGLIACITCQTEYVDTPPPNVISFRKICVVANMPEGLVESPPLPKPVKSSMTPEERIKVMKGILPMQMWPRSWRTEHAQIS